MFAIPYHMELIDTLFEELNITKGLTNVSTESAIDPWDFKVVFDMESLNITLRSLQAGDETHLLRFGEYLSAKSKELFCPYPWNDRSELQKSIKQAVDNCLQKTDASYLAIVDDKPAGHFFLWKAGGNPHSKQYYLDIPELGIGLADAYHGKGLGSIFMKTLNCIAKSLDKDAIELTTAMTNDAGFSLYQREGYIYTGVIRNPLEVDVTRAISGEVSATKYREERQMVLVLKEDKTTEIMQYLRLKREDMQKN